MILKPTHRHHISALNKSVIAQSGPISVCVIFLQTNCTMMLWRLPHKHTWFRYAITYPYWILSHPSQSLIHSIVLTITYGDHTHGGHPQSYLQRIATYATTFRLTFRKCGASRELGMLSWSGHFGSWDLYHHSMSSYLDFLMCSLCSALVCALPPVVLSMITHCLTRSDCVCLCLDLCSNLCLVLGI